MELIKFSTRRRDVSDEDRSRGDVQSKQSMKQNQDMDKYFNAEIGICRMVMLIFGMWPKETNVTVYVRLIVSLVLMIGFGIIPQTMNLIKVKDNFDELLDTITNCHLPVTVTVVKIGIFWWNRKALSWLLDVMAANWKGVKRETEQKIMSQNAKLSRLTTFILLGAFSQTVLLFLTVNAYKCSKESELFKQGKINASERWRPLYLASEFPYDVQKTPYYEITWILQFIVTTFAATSFIIIDGFLSTLILHWCAQMRNLRENLKHLLTETTQHKNKSKPLNLSTITERHEFLLSFAQTIEDVFNLQFFVQLLTSILIFCLNGYQIVLTITNEVIVLTNLFYAIYYYICFVSGLFVTCFIATIFSTESTKMREDVYDSEWYNLSSANAKLLLLIMTRTQRPLQLTAGKFVALSLNLYCSVLKTSGGYISMLLAMKDRLSDS